MASATTTEFVKPAAQPFSMIEQKGLARRLGEELARAADEFARDPRRFVRDLFTDDTRDAKRRRRLYYGLAFGVIAHAILIASMAVAGWHQMARVREKADESKAVTWVNPNDFKLPSEEVTDGSKQPRGSDGGGGGGGQNASRPATKGQLPQMAPAAQVVKLNAPSRPAPLLAVSPTITGPVSAPPHPDATLGIPNGQVGEPPSPGQGTGGGLGDGSGTGVGRGGGPGRGPGSGGSSGGGTAGSPEGTSSVPTAVDWRRPPRSGYTPFAWTYRARPIVTPEAQANKVIGTAIFRATLRADGVITDIELVNPVQFMTEAAEEALKRCKFRPATVDGVPVTLHKVLIRIDVHY